MMLPDEEKTEEALRVLAVRHCLTVPLTEILFAVILKWKRDMYGFRKAVLGVYSSATDPFAKALAIEYLSSVFDGEDRRGWSKLARDVALGLDEPNRSLLTAKAMFGLWDSGLEEFTRDQVRDALGLFIEHGAYDAAGRTLWFADEVLDVGDDADRAEAIELLGRVVALDLEATACNVYYHGKCQKMLSELTAA